MKIIRSIFCILFSVLFCTHSVALAGKQAPPFGESLEWNTGSEDPSLDALAGKSVLVMFFQDWCGICNGWSGQLFDQMTKAYGDDPRVVLIAIKTDGGDMSEALGYLSERTDVSKWMVAVDDGGVYQQQAMGEDKLYQYIWVTPEGEIGESGKSGMFYGGAKAKRFAVAEDKAQKNYFKGTYGIVPEGVELDGELDEAVALADKGLLLSALREVAEVSSSAPEEDVAVFRKTIAGLVKKSVTRHKAVVEDESSESRFMSFLALEKIVEDFGSSAPGVAAKEVVSANDRSSWVADEKEAASDYESIMRRAERADDERSRARIAKALAKLAEEFPETVYGRIAASAAKGK